jgi:hypothetical protein
VPTPLLIVRTLAARVVSPLHPPESVRQRAAYATAGVGASGSTGDAGPHARQR